MPDKYLNIVDSKGAVVQQKLVDNNDGTFSPQVATVGSGGGSGSDRELVVSTYSCKTAFTGASIGDTITATQVIDVTDVPTTVSVIWRNQSIATDLASAPAAANLETVGATALTDAQLRASAVPVSAASLPLPSGAATSAAQATGNTSLANIDADLGATADAAATTDTGSFSLIALVKRALQNWTTLLARVPALVSGRIPVDGSGVTQPVSAASLPLPTGAASTADIQAVRDRLPSAFLTPGLMAVDTLGTPGVARVQATSAVAASIVLTSTCRRVSMYATTGTWYSIGGTATATSHYLEAGGRLDFDVPANTTISVLAEATAGSVRITELV